MKSKRDVYTMWIRYCSDAMVALGRGQLISINGNIIVADRSVILYEKKDITDYHKCILKKINKCSKTKHRYLCTYRKDRRFDIFENAL